jgi:pimeloyl-ACP methyl ester carboxylesterase
MTGFWKLRTLLVLAGTCLVPLCFGQLSAVSKETAIRLNFAAAPTTCTGSAPTNAVEAALRLVCLRDNSGMSNMAVEKAIIIGFVGGFVRSHDMKHPEVQFAAHLREAYPSEVHAEVFSNHDGKHALRRVLQLLSEDEAGLPTSLLKDKARVIIYGHSWGASQAVTLAQDLGRLDIPVSLAILVDSVHKPGHDDAVIPPNVRNFVNFYQTRGLIHGRSAIRASDPKLTNMIGNFRMAYEDRYIDCDNYPWIARHLNKPHHEIENDPLVWEQISSMIDSELFKGNSVVEASLPSAPLVVKQDRR